VRFFLVLVFLVTAARAEQQPPIGALPELSFDKLSDRMISALGQKALSIRPKDWKHAETAHFVYHFFDRPMASAVSVEAEFHYRVIAAELGKDTALWERKCHLFLFDDEADWKQFQKCGGLDPWTGGIHGEGALFIRRNPGWQAENGTLPHEITHLVLYRFFGQGIPLWLNEGFAEYAATRCRASFYRARGFNSRPRAASVKAAHYIPLAELTSAVTYPADELQVIAFYEESQKLVRFLCAADRKAFSVLLESLGNGARLETAFGKSFGTRFLNLESIEREFKGYATSPLIPSAP
jgi:hypothetical protein